MTALASTDLSVVVTSQTITNLSLKHVTASITFGDGAKTYPTGGVPLDGGKLGLPNNIRSLTVIDQITSGNGYNYSYDTVHNTIRMAFPTGSHGHSLFLKNAAIADAAGNRVNAAASNLLGSNTGSNITVVASDGATTGGVVTNSGAVQSELANTIAPAALTIVVEAYGY